MNIYDIAKEANVSISTVSRVLNNKPNVNEETRKKVIEILNKHNYSPSAIARGLVSKHIKTIGILTIDIRVPHYAATAYAMERELHKMGYSVMLCNTGGMAETNIEYIRVLIEKGVCGIILIGSVFKDKYMETSIISNIENFPIVLINSKLRAENVYSVMIDEDHGLSLCVNHLYEKGHRDILYVQDADSHSAEHKVRAYCKAMKQIDQTVDDRHIFKTERSIAGGKAAMDSIIQSKLPFSAVVFGDDLTAVGGVFRLKELGYRIPQDVAVIGYNNSLYAQTCEPNITSVDNKAELIGMFAVKLLESLIEHREVSRSISIKPDLVIRGST